MSEVEVTHKINLDCIDGGYNLWSTGLLFLDITSLLLDPKAFKDTIDLFVERYKEKDISVVAGKRFDFF